MQHQIIQICVQAMQAANQNNPKQFLKHFKQIAAIYGHKSGYACPDFAGDNLNRLLQATNAKAHPNFFNNLMQYCNQYTKLDYNGGIADFISGWLMLNK